MRKDVPADELMDSLHKKKEKGTLELLTRSYCCRVQRKSIKRISLGLSRFPLKEINALKEFEEAGEVICI